MFKITFDYDQYGTKLYRYKKDLIAVADKVYDLLNLEGDIFFDCSFVDEETIQEINREYRHKDRVTDVISFALWENGIKTPLLGELYICFAKIGQQAHEYMHSFRRELCFLFLHGLLHLLGYDHMEPEEEKIMFGLQNQILDELQIKR